MEEDVFKTFIAVSTARPERAAVTFVGHRERPVVITSGEMLQRVTEQRARLRKAGLRPGDIVFMALSDSPDLVSLFVAAISIGCVPSIVQPREDVRDYQTRLLNGLRLVTPAMIVVEDGSRPSYDVLAGGVKIVEKADLTSDQRFDSHRPNGFETSINPSATAFLQFSSGSTGQQKAVAISHQALLHLIRSRGLAYGLTEGDTLVGWVPLNHDLGIVGYVLSSLLSAIPCILLATPYWLANPVTLMQAVNSVRSAVCTMPNFGLAYCASRIADASMTGLDLSHWRLLCCSAEPIRLRTLTGFVTSLRDGALTEPLAQLLTDLRRILSLRA